MPCKNKEMGKFLRRAADRTRRHGNWRQTYIDCGGMCIAQHTDTGESCCVADYLELHEVWGENQDAGKGKFQQRVCLCNAHHAMVDDHCHQYTFIQGQHQLSQLAEDINLEIYLAGSTAKWAEKYKLDESRWGCLRDRGIVKVAEMAVEDELLDTPEVVISDE